tara:strand:- start:77 stop:1120 length:1044 start_codon:yes stop_codon:yes gene_type:complete
MAATIPGAGITTPLTLTTADNTDQLTLKSTDADAAVGPVLTLHRESSSPADDDIIGRINFIAEDSGGTDTTYGRIETVIMQESNGSEDATMEFRIMKGGTERNVLELDRTAVIINEDSQDIDFRIEGDGLDDAFFVNAGASNGGQVCIGRQAGEGAEAFSVEQAYADWLQVNVHSVSSGNIYMFNNKFTGQAPDNNVSYFMNFQDFDGGATIRFRVFSDGDVQNHDNSYGSTSDERIKQGIRDANSQWDDIKALKVRNFKKNDDVRQYGDKAWEQIGVIAQELEASGMDKLVKNEVLWDKDDPEVKSGEATEGDIKEYKAVKYSVLYMKAIKALQEAMARIEALEAK